MEEPVVAHRRTKHVRRCDRGKYAGHGSTVRVEWYDGDVHRDRGGEARKHPPGSDLKEQVGVRRHAAHCFAEPDRLGELCDKQAPQVRAA